MMTMPPANRINYSDHREVCGYQMLLCKIYEREGGFCRQPMPNAVLRNAVAEGRIWLREVRNTISAILEAPAECQATMPRSGVIPALLSSYDVLHRICNGSPCFDYLRSVRLKTVDRWMKGDRSISQTDVVLMLVAEARRDSRTLADRYSDYCIGQLEQWIEELTCHGMFMDIPLNEAYKRLNYLLGNDLSSFTGQRNQENIKRRWVDAYTGFEVSDLDADTYLEYISFILTATRKGFYDREAGEEQYIHHLSTLITRPDLHEFYKEALQMGLETEMAYQAIRQWQI